MTRQEWDVNMARFMHRNDIAADLNVVFTFAVDQFFKSWMRKNTEALYADDNALLDAAPRPMHHFGLMYLHQLAQDDVGIAREQQLAEEAMSDFVHWWSLNNVSTDMLATQETA